MRMTPDISMESTGMENVQKPIPWLSGCIATFIALLIVAVMLPNTDRVVIDQTVSPPQAYIQPQPWVVCAILALTFLPVLCIFILGKRWILFDWASWAVLAFLLVRMFAM